nr:hypothetical protein CFP56_74350 [Quercus suber]
MERSERSLSLEEQAELARNNKKVKNVSHDGFCEGHSPSPSSPSFAGGSSSKNVSFKDKLMGEKPGAYTQAFCFEEFMEDDAESDDEVETLRQGDHFLSVRPWEPDFKPESANVSSIAMWIRLSGLLIEYYNAKALQHIGKAIGNVLRIDTFTATESRGKFARLCIQVDVDKPLVTTVMIGKLQQAVTYEGIHNLCFECGRLGHRKELCPFVIKPMPMLPCKEADLGGVGPHGKEHVAIRKDEHEELYGPWVVVALRKKETKIQRSGGYLPDHGLAYEQRSNGLQVASRKTWAGVEKVDGSSGLNRETKRKLSPVRILEKAQVEQVIHRIGKEAQTSLAHVLSLSLKGKESKLKVDKARKANSVKAMRAVARARAVQNSQSSAARELNAPFQGAEMRSKEMNAPVHLKGCTYRDSGNGDTGTKADGDFQFAAAAVSDMGQNRRGSIGLNSDQIGCEVSIFELNHGVGLLKDQEGVEGELTDTIRLGMENSDGLGVPPSECAGIEEGPQKAHYIYGLVSDENGGRVAYGADKMDLEGGEDGEASL